METAKLAIVKIGKIMTEKNNVIVATIVGFQIRKIQQYTTKPTSMLRLN